MHWWVQLRKGRDWVLFTGRCLTSDNVHYSSSVLPSLFLVNFLVILLLYQHLLIHTPNHNQIQVNKWVRRNEEEENMHYLVICHICINDFWAPSYTTHFHNKIYFQQHISFFSYKERQKTFNKSLYWEKIGSTSSSKYKLSSATLTYNAYVCVCVYMLHLFLFMKPKL